MLFGWDIVGLDGPSVIDNESSEEIDISFIKIKNLGVQDWSGRHPRQLRTDLLIISV